MSRRDSKLHNVPTMRTAVVYGTGELIPRSGDNRIAITDICHNGYRPVILRQDPSTGNPSTGEVSKHFLGLPISGSSNFKTPVISDQGVSIYNATDSAIQGAQNPITDKVLVSANYYYFREEYASYFDTSLRMRVRLTLSSSTLTKSQLAAKYAEVRLGSAGSNTLRTFRQTGLGESEQTYLHEEPYDLAPATDKIIELSVITNIDMNVLTFQGSNNPTTQTAPYPNRDPQGGLRYFLEAISVADPREWGGNIRLHHDALDKDTNYNSREVFVDIVVIV
jgi:hypothetical protein